MGGGYPDGEAGLPTGVVEGIEHVGPAIRRSRGGSTYGVIMCIHVCRRVRRYCYSVVPLLDLL